MERLSERGNFRRLGAEGRQGSWYAATQVAFQPQFFDQPVIATAQPSLPTTKTNTSKQLLLPKLQHSLPWIAQGPARFLANARVPAPQVTTPPMLEEDPARLVHAAVRELPTERVQDLELRGLDQGQDQFPGEDLEAAEGAALPEVPVQLVSRVLR